MGISALVKLMKFKLHLLCVCVYTVFSCKLLVLMFCLFMATLVVTTIKHYINNVKQLNIKLIMVNYYD